MINSTNKTQRNEGSVYDGINSGTNIKYGVVRVLENETGPEQNKGLGRIKVYIKGPIATGGDADRTDSELPWCFPLLPKHLQVQPKVGEVVMILTFSDQQQHADRLYIGPIISQLPLLEKDPYLYSALNGFTFALSSPTVNPSQIAELNGVFPKPDDISIQGRYNTDITQKKNEIVIRAGKFVESTPNTNNPYSFKYNPTTQAYIQLKNDVVTDPTTNQQTALRGTVANIVANKINLITHKDGSPRFNITDPDVLITDDELNKILVDAHQIPFGDVLLEYLKLFKEAFLYHVHNGSGNRPTDLTVSGNKQAVEVFKLKAEIL
jgi:hypothetical protein